MSVIQFVRAGEYEVPRSFRAGVWVDYAGTVTRRLTVTSILGYVIDDGAGGSEWSETDTETDELLNPTPAAVVSALRDLGVSFDATGTDEDASLPDGSRCVDYRTGEREEIHARVSGFTPMQMQAIREWTDDNVRPSSVMFL
jgi:hypothetical protein